MVKYEYKILIIKYLNKINNLNNINKKHFWVLIAYFGQGFLYSIASVLSIIFYKNMGLPNTQITVYASLFLLPWLLKPVMVPFLEKASKQKLSCCLLFIAGVVLILPFICDFRINFYFIIFLILGFVGANFDAVTDGLYLKQLSPKAQAQWVGPRTVFYQLSKLCVQGLAVMCVGYFIASFGFSALHAWSILFLFIGCIIFCLGGVLYYQLFRKNNLNLDLNKNKNKNKNSKNYFLNIFKAFFKLPGIFSLILFLFIYNAAETQLIKILPLYLLSEQINGGLGLSISDLGVLEIIGLFGMTLGVALSGWLISRFSLKRTFSIFAALMGLSTLGFLGLLILKSALYFKLFWVGLIVFCIYFGFGLGNAAYMVYMMQRTSGHLYSMSFYSFCVAIMIFSSILFGAVSGYVSHVLGYIGFYLEIFTLSCLIWVFTMRVSK